MVEVQLTVTSVLDLVSIFVIVTPTGKKQSSKVVISSDEIAAIKQVLKPKHDVF